MQTQTSSALYNTIIEASAPKTPAAPDTEGNSQTHTYRVKETYATVTEDIRKQLDAEAETVQIIFTGIDNDIYSIIDSCLNAIETSKAATKNKGKAIANSPLLTYDPKPKVVANDEASSKEKEIDKLMNLILMSFKKIYKPTNNNLGTSSNTRIMNVDNTLRTNRGTGYDKQTGYDNQREVNVARARENVVLKWPKDLAYHKEKMLLCKQEEARIQLSAKQVNWRDDTNDELEDHELKALYIHAKDSKGDTHITSDSSDMSNNAEDADQDDDLAKERDLLDSLIEKLKCEINDSKT
nr:hypothetical protein [Tanacetum cinerariifolium]